MTTIDSFSLEDIRCFEGLQKAEIRPITLLVGENSTGKSTFLGCFDVLNRLLTDSPFSTEFPNFNVDPFSMGSFPDIVRYRGGQAGRIKQFALEVEYCVSPPKVPLKLRMEFLDENSQPVLAAIDISNEKDETIRFESNMADKERTKIIIPRCSTTIYLPLRLALMQLDFPLRSGRGKDSSVRKINKYVEEKLLCIGKRNAKETRRFQIFPDLRWSPVIPVAPLRAKPQRTYDPIGDTLTPEGIHVPMYLMRLARQGNNEWDTLNKELIDFGKQSSLFSHIGIKGHGKGLSDPFQVTLKIRSGATVNLMDVGYGVSQSLPILVDIYSRPGTTFLLQQPEVHLHPRGQAELGSFFVDRIHGGSNRFLVETHSDYIVNRVAINVREKKISPDDVAILYFEAKGKHVNIHNISFDKYGNVIGAPKGYREFFMEETDRVLGF